GHLSIIILAQMQQGGNRKLNQAVVDRSPPRAESVENRTNRAAGRKRAAAPLWRHRAGGIMAYGSIGCPGSRCDLVRERRFANYRQVASGRSTRAAAGRHS